LILADTTVWIDHFRAQNLKMRALLQTGQIVIHPFIAAELALGSLHDRASTLSYLDALPRVRVAQTGEVRAMVELHSVYGKGIGLVDAHLLTSTLIDAGTQLWTLDKRLRSVAEALSVHVSLP
jgi:hypothetical protein